jgi:hypothetical protein
MKPSEVTSSKQPGSLDWYEEIEIQSTKYLRHLMQQRKQPKPEQPAPPAKDETEGR